MNDKHYNPAIAVRLRGIVEGRQWSVLLEYLSGLSNAQFRTAGYMLGEKYMPTLSLSDFWNLAKVLVDWNSKAFLVTVLKSFVQREGDTHTRLFCNDKSLDNEPKNTDETEENCAADAFFLSLKEKAEDQRKTLQVLLPVLTSLEDVERLLRLMDYRDAHQRIVMFVSYATPVTAFLLLQAMREVEDDRALLVRAVYQLIKRGDSFSFNLAALLRAYFGLEEVKGTFSLRIQPYELARLSTNFEAFKQAIK